MSDRALLDEQAADMPQPQEGTQANDAPTLAIIVPTLCEAENIRLTLDRVRSVLDPMEIRYEIVVVDDDSSDATGAIVSTIADEDPRVRLVVRKGKRGVAGATLLGWQNTNAAILGAIDADLQHPPELLSKLVTEVLDGRDLAIGSRYATGGSLGEWNLARKVLSVRPCRWRSRFRRSRFEPRTRLRGTFSSGATAFRVCAFKRPDSNCCLRFSFAAMSGSIAEVPYSFSPRTKGESKATFKVACHYALLLSRLYWTRFGLHFHSPGETSQA